MSERIGQEVRTDQALLSYARGLWATDEYKAWRAHMWQDVSDGLDHHQTAEDHPEEA